MKITFDWLNVARECVFNSITNNKIINFGGRSFFGKLHEPGDECQLWMRESSLQFNAYTIMGGGGALMWKCTNLESWT
jgi:hypothetical protein